MKPKAIRKQQQQQQYSHNDEEYKRQTEDFACRTQQVRLSSSFSPPNYSMIPQEFDYPSSSYSVGRPPPAQEEEEVISENDLAILDDLKSFLGEHSVESTEHFDQQLFSGQLFADQSLFPDSFQDEKQDIDLFDSEVETSLSSENDENLILFPDLPK